MATSKNILVRRALLIVAVPGALILGIGIGGASSETVTVPGPAPAPIVKTETKTIKVETIPTVCLDALRNADDVNVLASEAFGIAGDAMMAAGNFDLEAMTAANDALSLVHPKYQTAMDDYVFAASTCRASETN